MQLTEQYRPKTWQDVIGQDKAIATIQRLMPRGLAGRAYWISGASGTGKTTIAKLLAAEVANDWATEELDAQWLTPARLKDLGRQFATKPLGGGGWAVIVNEAHGLSREAIKQLLVMIDPPAAHVAWLFTTTTEGQQSLFADCDDTAPLLSRCTELALSRQGLAKPFAERAKAIAEREGLDGQPIERYIKLTQLHKNNLRRVLQDIEAGSMLVA